MPKGFTYSLEGPYKKKEVREMKTRDEKGRFVARRETSLGEVALLLNEAADILIKKENEPPAWLKSMVVAMATAIGVEPGEFEERVRIIHPTPKDPCLLIDGKARLSWI